MKKKFTMLLAALLCCVGVAKAEVTLPDAGKSYTVVAESHSSGAKPGWAINNEKTAMVSFGNTAIADEAQKEFAFVQKEGKVYLYSVWAKKFVNKDMSLADALPIDDIKVENVDGGKYYFKYDNSRIMNIGGDKQLAPDGWSTKDGGNQYTLIVQKEFDLTEALQILNNTVNITCEYVYNGDVKYTATIETSPGVEYTIPALDYTKIVSCKIGEEEQTVTDGACIITVPEAAATVTVELEANLPFTVSVNYENATWYAMQIRGNKYVVRNEAAPYSNTTTTPTTEDALWAFVGNPFDGIQVLNKAAGTGYTLGYDEIGSGKNIYMKEGVTTWNIQKGNGGFVLCQDASKNEYIHDYGDKLQYWVDGGAKTDKGSAFIVTSEADMISLATAAKNNLSSKLDVYAEASYYTYSNEAVAAAKAALQAIATPTTLLAALQAKAAVEAAQAGLTNQGTTGPVAGDIIMLKNRNYNKYLKANDADLTSVESRNDLAALWVVEAGDEGNVKLKNYSTGKYIGQIRQSATVAMEEAENAKQFAFIKQDDVYAVFHETTGGDYAYGHINGGLVGWLASANASQWVVSNVCPLSITYLFNGETVSTSTEIVEAGTVYTISSPYAFTVPSAVTVGETALEAIDGVYSFKVTEATTVKIELKEDLPFVKTVLNEDGSFPENTAWYVVKQHSNYPEVWKYDETNGVTTEATTTYTDNHLWCFVGSKDDLKIYNKVAGSGVSLTNTTPAASLVADNAAVWKMIKSDDESSFAGKNPFCLQNGDANSYLNRQGHELKYWSAKDAGSTIMVISQSAIELAALVNRLNGIITTLEDNAGNGIGYYESAEDVAKLKNAIDKAQVLLDSNSKKNEDYVAAIAELNEAEAKATKIELPESGKYYRIGYDYGSEVGIKYMQSVSSSVKGLNMTSDSDVMSVVFYYADGKLQSLDTKGYLKEDGNTRGLQANANNAGTITFSAGSVLGKIKIQAPSYLHANQNNGNYFIDHCGSDVDHAQHNFVIEEVTIEELNGIYLNGCAYITALDYTENSNHPVIVNNARSNWAVADKPVALNTLAKLGLTKDVSDTKQQFAIITPDGGKNYYLYSVHAKRYLKSNNTFGAQGEPILFNDASSRGENKVQVRFKGVEKYINVGGSNQMVIDDWGTIDVGNACEMVQCNTLTFNLDEALEIFNNGADITLTYKLGDKLVSTTTYETQGETFSFNNPYAFTTVTSCKKDGEDLEATEGTYSFEITGDAHIVVELQENLPFRYAASYDKIEYWYFMKIRDDGFTYLGYDAEKAYIRANQSNVPVDSKDAYTWGFVGNPFDGFSIVNYATGKTKVLSAPIAPTENKKAEQLARMVEVTNEYTGNLVWNIKAPTHATPMPGVFYIEHPTANSYAFNRQGYDGANALCYWTGRDTGSAIQVVERGVFNLSDLSNVNVYTLQAERSPLMYSATEGMTTKLSSGLVDEVSADASDINQQFLILRTNETPEGQYYLYSIGAGKFVDANLNFVDYPEPVLSFEAYNGTNSVVYPWWVKIDGKYVIPGDGGTAGNKLYHTTAGDDDDGKRYRIVNAGKSNDNSVLSKIEEAEAMVKATSELSNEKVYTVSTYDRGSWYYNSEKEALWSTGKDGVEFSSSDEAQQFAFLTVAGHTYLYSVGAQKFVVKNEGYTTYSDVPSQMVEFLTAGGSKFYPFVVALVNGDNKHHIGVSNTYEPPVITFYNDLNDGGNKIKIREVESEHMSDGTVELLAAAVNKIDAYLAAQEFKPELAELIAEAEALLAKNYLDAEDATSLTNAKTAAQAVYDAETSGSAALTEQIELLTEAIATAAYVRDIDEFKNSYVYTFVTKRGWVGADENSENLIGTVNSKVDPAPTPSEDNAMFQWAVYKSANENYYLYNIGKAMFMGMPSGETIPFVATPQGQSLTFKRHDNANWAEYPIMFSPDNKGAVSQNGTVGLFYWNGGWNKTDDDGSNYKVTVVGKIPEASLTAIAEAVELYELYELKLALGECLNTFRSNYYDGWAPTDYKWRDQAGVNNYTIGLDDALTLEEYYNNAKAVLDDQESTIVALNGQKNLLESVVSSMTINQPEAGKFYRLRCVDGQKYLQSTVNESNKRLTLTGDMGAAAMFCYHEGALLSYTTGLYMDHRVFNAVGVKSEVTFSEAANGSKGCYIIKVGDSYHIYGAGSDLDSGSGTPDNRNGYNWWLEEVTTLPVSISEVKYTTFYTPIAVEVPEAVEAYIVQEIISKNGTQFLDLIQVTGVVPAHTGLILKGEQGTYNFDMATEDAQKIDANLLQGTNAKTVITPETGYTCYVLAKTNDVVNPVAFYPIELTKNNSGGKPAADEAPTSFINGANKIYLPVETLGGQAPALMFRFGTTDVEDIVADKETEPIIYDLMGRRVEKMVEGIYIVNGKKVVIK